VQGQAPLDGSDVNDSSPPALNHLRKKQSIEANGGKEVEVKLLLPKGSMSVGFEDKLIVSPNSQFAGFEA
jgi:hypothetical protein